MNDVMWINPEPGYGTPKDLRDMDDNSAKIFPRWLSWEKENNVGFVLFDESEAKWWADPASVHILSRAQGYKITYNYFSFIVKRENRLFTYGFVAKNYAQEAQLRNFAEFGREMGNEEPPRIQHKGFISPSQVTVTKTIIPPPAVTTQAAAASSNRDEEPPHRDVSIDSMFIDDVDFTEIDDEVDDDEESGIKAEGSH